MDNTNNLELTAAMALTADYDGIAVIDTEKGKILNDSNHNIFSPHVEGSFDKISYEGHLDSFIDQLVVEEYRSKVRTAMNLELVNNSLFSKKSYYVNYRINLNGNMKYYQTKFCRVPSTDGGCIAVGTYDISAPLSEFLHRVDSAKRQAEAINEAKNQFLTNLSHDIRTPLNGVMGLMEMAKRNVTDVNKVSKYLENMANESNHLQSLLNDVCLPRTAFPSFRVSLWERKSLSRPNSISLPILTYLATRRTCRRPSSIYLITRSSSPVTEISYSSGYMKILSMMIRLHLNSR